LEEKKKAAAYGNVLAIDGTLRTGSVASLWRGKQKKRQITEEGGETLRRIEIKK